MEKRAQLQTPDNRQAVTKQKVTGDSPLKTSKTESKAAQGYQLFWLLLRNGNRINESIGLPRPTSTTLRAKEVTVSCV
jgi:hypothetical protein